MSKPVKKRSSVLSGVFLLAGSRLCVGGKLAPRGGMSTMWTGAVEVANIAPYTFTLVKQVLNPPREVCMLIDVCPSLRWCRVLRVLSFVVGPLPILSGGLRLFWRLEL